MPMGKGRFAPTPNQFGVIDELNQLALSRALGPLQGQLTDRDRYYFRLGLKTGMVIGEDMADRRQLDAEREEVAKS